MESPAPTKHATSATSSSARSWRPFLQAYVVAGAFALTIVAWPSLSRIVEIFLVAAFAAVALDASVRALQRAVGISRRVGLLLVLGTGIITATAGALFALPVLVRELTSLRVRGPRLAQQLANTDAWNWLSDQTGVKDGAVRAAQKFVGGAPSVLGSAFTSIVGTAFNGVIILFAMLFLLASGRSALTMAVRIVPGVLRDRPWDVIAEIYESIGRYIIGAIGQATIAGFVVGLMLFIVDVPYALALGIITFFWDFIPMIGSTIAGIPCVIVAYASQGLGTAIFVGVFVTVFTQIENSVIQPRIQGGKAQLPGAAIFFSVMIGGTMFGITGAIAAVPAASVVATILRHWNEHRGVADLELPQLFDDRGQIIRSASSAK